MVDLVFAYEGPLGSQGSCTATILASTWIARLSALSVAALFLLTFICRIFIILVVRVARSSGSSYEDITAGAVCCMRFAAVNTLKYSVNACFAFHRTGFAFV